MKILNARQSKEADKYTIDNEPVPSLDLMERAAMGMAENFLRSFSSKQTFYIFCGKGNNGGDGLALARILSENYHIINVLIVEKTGEGSEDFNINLKRLRDKNINCKNIGSTGDLPEIPDNAIVVDAVFGSGLNRQLEGLPKEIVEQLNQSKAFKVAIDIPSGLFADNNRENDLEKVFRADLTLTINQPKLSFFHRDSAPLAGDFEVIDIHLHPDFLQKAESDFHYVDFKEAKEIYKARNFFTYKNKFGHALIIAGSEGKSGAAILSAKGAMHAGAGLVSVCTTKAGLIPLQSTLPEAMVIPDQNERYISECPDLKNFSSIVMGPGIGKNRATAEVLKKVLEQSKAPLILDADSLNILSGNREWIPLIPPNTILTPHIGEYKRLMNIREIGVNYLEEMKDLCKKYSLFMVLKDAISTITTPQGQQYFIKSGSPALATAGSGDTLCGILAALSGSGYSRLEALLLGVWMHGRAGKLAGIELSEEATLAGDISLYLGKVFKELKGDD